MEPTTGLCQREAKKCFLQKNEKVGWRDGAGVKPLPHKQEDLNSAPGSQVKTWAEMVAACTFLPAWQRPEQRKKRGGAIQDDPQIILGRPQTSTHTNSFLGAQAKWYVSYLLESEHTETALKAQLLLK